MGLAHWSVHHRPYAVVKALRAASAVAALLDGFAAHLNEAGLGTVSEIFDAEPPFAPRGCIAQAWSVAELLRAGVEDVSDYLARLDRSQRSPFNSQIK